MSKQGYLGTFVTEVQGGKNWYGSLKDGLVGLLQIKSDAAVSTERFYLWMEEILIGKINQSMNAY